MLKKIADRRFTYCIFLITLYILSKGLEDVSTLLIPESKRRTRAKIRVSRSEKEWKFRYVLILVYKLIGKVENAFNNIKRTYKLRDNPRKKGRVKGQPSRKGTDLGQGIGLKLEIDL